jgi:hypothetical protein
MTVPGTETGRERAGSEPGSGGRRGTRAARGSMRRAALPRAGITAGMMSPTTTEKMALALEELIAIVCEIVREASAVPGRGGRDYRHNQGILRKCQYFGGKLPESGRRGRRSGAYASRGEQLPEAPTWRILAEVLVKASGYELST